MDWLTVVGITLLLAAVLMMVLWR